MVNCTKSVVIIGIFGHGFIRMPGSWFKTVSLLALAAPTGVLSDNAAFGEPNTRQTESARIYSSLEERRTAGQGFDITDWLTVSGLLEAEAGQKRDKIRNGISERREDNLTATVQIGLEAAFSESLTAELLFESEWDDGQRSVLDEAFLALEDRSWKAEAGRLYLPFGQYFSHFITGPLLEFGETRGTALTASFSLNESARYGVFVFDGETESRKKKSDTPKWGLYVDFLSANRSVRAGASYLSDLTEAQEISDFDFSKSERNQVGGFSGYFLIGQGPFELSAEFTRALQTFSAFEVDQNRPTAWNVELVYAPRTSLLFALRLEGSSELPEEPENQAGLSATWRINNFSSISVEYLFGRYKDGFVLDDNGNPLSTRKQFAVQFAAEF